MTRDKKTAVDRVAPGRISRIAFGLRYQPQYGLTGLLGTVVDEILRNPGTPFGPETFPLSEATPTAYRLTDSENNALRLSTHDTVLQLALDSSNLERITQVGEEFQRFVLDPLRKAGLANITRYGVLLHLASVHDQYRLSPIRTYLGADSDARSLSLRYTRRLPSFGALAMKHVNDFRNAIYTIEQAETGAVSLSLDYQENFEPALDAKDWADRPFPACVARAVEFCDRDLRHWLKKLTDGAEAA